MQTADKHQDLENVYRRIQHAPHRFHRRQQDFLCPRWTESQFEEYG